MKRKKAKPPKQRLCPCMEFGGKPEECQNHSDPKFRHWYENEDPLPVPPDLVDYINRDAR